MAEFRLPTRWVRFVPYCSAYPPSRWGIVEKLRPEIKNPPATEATGGGSWAFALILDCYIPYAPEDTHAPQIQHVQVSALFCVSEIICTLLNEPCFNVKCLFTAPSLQTSFYSKLKYDQLGEQA
jgi:hypothetical protein